MQRDMSYDLDDALALRSAGEVTLAPAVRTRMLRTPGLAPVRPANGPTVEAPDLQRDDAERATGLADLTVDLPVLGQVNLLHVGLAIGATILVCKMLKKH